MQIPELPTDNLYKFMAIFGFVLSVLCFGYLVVQITNTATSLAKLEVAGDAHRRVSEIENDFIDRQTGFLEQLAESLRVETEGVMASAYEAVGQSGDATGPAVEEGTISSIEQQLHLLNSELGDLRQELRSVGVAQTERANPILQELAALGANNDIDRWLSLVLTGAGIAGAFISIHGFRLWYNRVQVYQDAILKAQASRTVGADLDGAAASAGMTAGEASGAVGVG